MGKTTKLEVEGSDTVLNVKEKIAKKEEISISTIRLVHDQKQLDNDQQTMDALGITEGAELFLVLKLGGTFSVHQNVNDKWSEYMAMLKRINWRSVPKSFESIESDRDNKITHLLNAINDYTKNDPSTIKTRQDLLDILKEMTEYTLPTGISDGETFFYDYYKDYIEENIGYNVKQGANGGSRNNDPLLGQNDRGCCIVL